MRMLFTEKEKSQALQLARKVISYGARHQQKLQLDAKDYNEGLQKTACCFVSLHKGSELRGCMGSLEPRQALVYDVADHAYAAAFNDYRFSSVQAAELDELDIEISVLSEKIALRFESEEDLLEQLQPNVDGLVIEEGGKRATFLPVVWQQLPNRNDFLIQLKRKAGMADDYWSRTIKAYRYHTDVISKNKRSEF